MTREEALSKVKGYLADLLPSEEYDEVEEIIKALEPCEDAISRQAVLALITEYQKGFDAVMNIGGKVSMEELADDIKLLNSSVTPQPKTGHWIQPQQDDGMSDPIYYQVRCSKCGFDLDPQTWHMELHQYDADKYCPRCGAKMIEPQESEVNNE